MKILYAIQGTGNGHISRALEIVPALKKKAAVDVLISGSAWELKLPFDIDYKMHGLGFIFGRNGGVDMLSTYLQMDSRKLMKEIQSLPVEKYDLIISDFEPVSCWAARLKNKLCVGLSNQAVTLHTNAPRPKHTDRVGKMILQHYAPAHIQYGFHFKRFDENVYTPIIRNEIRSAEIEMKDHVTVYLPSYDDQKIIDYVKQFKEQRWEIFSKHGLDVIHGKNFSLYPLNSRHFVKSLAAGSGLLSNAGFGAASEALFLGKKLMVIPMKAQYEQHCNAAVLESMGVHTVKSLKKKKSIERVSDWLINGKSIEVDYPDRTEAMLDMIVNRHAGSPAPVSGSAAIYPEQLFLKILQATQARA